MSETDPEERDALPVIISFIRSLGISVQAAPLDGEGFLPGVVIRDGGLVYDPDAAPHPGDLLHEAGHLALLEPAKRRVAAGDLAKQFPEEAGSEIAVILWTFLACRHLSVSPGVVFHDEGYRGQGQWLRGELEGGNYIGLPLLVWMRLVREKSGGGVEVVSWLRGGA